MGTNSSLHSKMSMKMWKILRHGNRVNDMVGACRHGLAKTARWLKRNRESANVHETAPLLLKPVVFFGNTVDSKATCLLSIP